MGRREAWDSVSLRKLRHLHSWRVLSDYSMATEKRPLVCASGLPRDSGCRAGASSSACLRSGCSTKPHVAAEASGKPTRSTSIELFHLRPGNIQARTKQSCGFPDREAFVPDAPECLGF